VRLGLAWALVPGILFTLASLVGPYFTLRYLTFCVPGVALLCGLAIAQFRRSALRLGLVIVLALLIFMSDTPLFSNAGKDGWGTTLRVLAAHGAPGEYVLPTTPVNGNEYALIARVTGLPHQMTLIDFGRSLPWTSTISTTRWSSLAKPPTHVIWLVSRFGVIDCSEIRTLGRWGFTMTAQFGTRASPTYEFVSPRPTTLGGQFMACSAH
jgi:hypothetical protein